MNAHRRERRPDRHLVAQLLRGAAPVLATLLLPGIAGAQMSDLTDPTPASSGTTEIGGAGFEAEAALGDGPDLDSSHLRFSAGGLLTTGSARTLALTSAVDQRMRRGDSQLSMLGAVNFGKSAQAPDAPYRTSVENLQGRVRYDHFVLPRVATLLGVSLRRDRFQGLALRINIDPGVAYYFIDAKAERLWFEFGYDLQHDLRHDSVLDAAGEDEGVVVESRETRHSSRLFAGYDNHLSALFSLSAALEYIQSVQDGLNWRLNADAGLSVHLDGHFAIAITLALKHDNHPLPGVPETDTTTSFSLVYAL